MSKSNNRNSVLKRFNIIDISIVLLILIFLAGGMYKLSNREVREQATKKSIQVRLLVREREALSLDKINVGDVIKEFDTGIVFGEIINIDVRPAIKEVKTADGEVKLAEVPDRYDLYIDVDASAIVSSNSIMSGNKELRVGSRLILKTKLYALNSNILEIKE